MSRIVSTFRVWMAIALVTILVTTVGCGTKRSTLKIGVLVPMTGSSANYGELMSKGARLAADEINASGGIDGKHLELVIEDSKGQPQEGQSAFNKMVTADKVPVVLIAFSGVIEACLPSASSSRVPLINCPANSPKFRNRPFLWNINILSDQEGYALAQFARKNMHSQKAAILYVNNESGQGFRDVFDRDYTKLGGKIVLADGHDQGTKDFRAILTRVRASSPDLVFIPSYYLESALILKQANEMGLRCHWLTYSAQRTPDFLKIAGPAANGTCLSLCGFDPDAASPQSVSYSKAYEKKYGTQAETWGAQFYDAVKLVAERMKGGAVTGEQLDKALASMQQYDGVAGPIKFAKDHTVTRSIRFKTVADGKFVDYKD